MTTTELSIPDAGPPQRQPTPDPQASEAPAADVLARSAFDGMADKQAADLMILDIRPVSLITDFFVIGTAESGRQFKAILDAVEERIFKQTGAKPVHIEGQPDSGWVLMDYGDIVVHIFDPERRQFYALESMWSEAPLVARMA